MKFHPDQNRPGCQLQGSMNSCLGYQTLRDEWNRQHWRIEALEAALRLIADIAEGSTTANSLPHVAKIARAALAPEQDK